MSYDSVAELYEDVAAPLFRRLAIDLVAAVGLTPTSVVLDVGSGTGFAADAATSLTRGNGMVVRIEPSAPMLRIALPRMHHGVLGVVPGLPFRSAGFDAAIANLVLSHLVDLDAGLKDIARVVREGGRFAASAWGEVTETLDDDDGAAAADIVTDAFAQFGLPTKPPTSSATSEQALTDPDYLRSALAGSGFADVHIEERAYRQSTAVADYVRELDWFGRGRYHQSAVDDATLARFRHELIVKLAARFGGGIRRTHRFRIAAGTRAERPN
jgi:ubiquinone/menaquinone biosynthesis C-methylase UbiE